MGFGYMSLPYFTVRRICFAMVFLSSIQASAKSQQSPPSIQVVLNGVQSKINETIADLPNIDCDEHGVSTYSKNGDIKREITEDSIVTARRISGKAGVFEESRNFQLVNNKPLKNKKKYNPPFTVSGGFGWTFRTYLSRKYESCNTYKVLPGNVADGNWLELEVKRNNRLMKIAPCGKLNENAVAIFLLDPSTYQIHELKYTDSPANLHVAGMLSLFTKKPDTVTIKSTYGLVPLGKSLYLLPRSLMAEAWNAHVPNVKYQYKAEYGKCNMFKSSVTVITNQESIE